MLYAVIAYGLASAVTAWSSSYANIAHIEYQAGLAAGWVILFGPRYLWVLVPAQLLRALYTLGPDPSALTHVTTEILIGPIALVLRRGLRFSESLESHRDVLRMFFVLLSASVLAACTASIGGALAFGPPDPGVPGFKHILSGHFLGALVTAPLLWNIWLRPIDSGPAKHVLQGYAALLIYDLLVARIYSVDYRLYGPEQHFMVLSLLSAAWALFRLGIRGAVLINLMYLSTVLPASMGGLGPLAQSHPDSPLAAVWAYAAGVSLLSLLLACMVRERHWTVEESGRGERYFKRLIENATDNVAVLEANGVIRYENPSVRALGGWNVEDLVGRNAFEFIHPDDVPQAWAAYQQGLRHPGDAYKATFRLKTKSGGWIYVESTGRSLLHDPDVRGVIISSRDVTERERVLQELVLLLSAIEQSAESVVLTDREGLITYVNAGFEKTTGYTRQEAIGQNPRILKSGKHPEEFYRGLWEQLLGGQLVRTVFINKRKNGELYYDAKQISPMRDAKGTIIGFVAVGQDITEQRSMEEQFRHAQKMEAVGRLAGGIAHDFNNLLTVIIGYSKIALPRVSGDTELRSALEAILLAGERASGLTRQLLAFSRKQVAQAQPFVINELIQQSESMYRFMCGVQIRLRLELAPGIRPVFADPVLMDQVIINLIVNAKDAMPEGGELAIRTLSVRPEPSGGSAGDSPRGQVAIEVSDTGLGMTDEIKSKIFEPFFTTKPKDKGTGLGLPTVYGIIEQAGGSITVDSSPGHGTTFRILLPESPEPAKSLRQTEAAVLKSGQGRLVMLVDDEKDVRGLAASALRGQQYEVIEAANGEEALDKVWRLQGRVVDLLVTDMIMPGMTGRELADKYKVLSPSTRTLIISGFTEKVDFLKEGESFLQKPFSPIGLLTAVQQALSSGGV
ncbi:MAG: Sensor histidine kinase RcsC [Candidatus Omnitrophica bacterium]|nr:Sensor histidine kinase RcsC [Candidatus Omnitrophota bacterium]